MLTERLGRWWGRIAAPGWVRPLPTSAQRRTDILLVALYFVVAPGSAVVADTLAVAFGAGPLPDWRWQAVWIVALGLPLVWRRRFPICSMLVVSTVFLVSQHLGHPDNLMASVALFWSMYSVGAWSRHRVAAFWSRVVVVSVMFATIAISYLTAGADLIPDNPGVSGLLTPYAASVLNTVLVNILYFAASTYFGTVAWTSARRESLLADQAAVLEAAQRDNAQRAVTRERLHIARELHDVVAHHVSVMGVQASAARRVLGKSPELATDALSAVENTARVAITELRGLLGVLRDATPVDETAVPTTVGPPTETLHPAPGVQQIPALVAQAESTGLRIGYGVFGTPRPVPAGMSLSLFRIVQEALTNVVKHASATRVDVRLRYREASMVVEITDDGLGAVSRSPRPGAVPGYGLVGMRERVAVHGGELVAGPRDTGGFRVRADLPTVGAEPAGQRTGRIEA